MTPLTYQHYVSTPAVRSRIERDARCERAIAIARITTRVRLWCKHLRQVAVPTNVLRPA
jgi:hypothetical protein